MRLYVSVTRLYKGYIVTFCIGPLYFVYGKKKQTKTTSFIAVLCFN